MKIKKTVICPHCGKDINKEEEKEAEVHGDPLVIIK